MKKPFGLLFLTLISLTMMISCDEVDIKLINQIKTFGPKWTIVGNKLNYIDRNLIQIEKRFEKDYAEVKPLLGQVADSLRTGTYYRNITAYQEMIPELDTIRTAFTDHKKTYSETVQSFHVWERKVMKGDVAEGIAVSDLTKFKQTWSELDQWADMQTKDLEVKVALHNKVMRSITDKLGIFTNYDIDLK